MCGSTTQTSSTGPNSQVLQNYQDVYGRAKTAASTPYTPYGGELVAGINQGQQNAIGQLQGSYGLANPYLNTGSSYLNNAAGGLGNTGNYLQAASGFGANAAGAYGQGLGATGAMSNALGLEQQGLGRAQGYFGQAAGLASPQQFDAAALQQYMSPYQNQVIDATRANLNANNAQQAKSLASNAIGSGAFGGDRAGIAANDLSRQQSLADGATIGNLQNQGYQTALGQFNTTQAQRQQAAGIYAGLGQAAGQNASLYGNVAQGYGQQASAYGNFGQGYAGLGNLYNQLGNTQNLTAQLYGGLAGQAGNLGQLAQNTAIAGASAGLQGSTLQQQNQQQQDQAAFGQYQAGLAYPFQTSQFLTNAALGIGGNSGTLTTTPGPSMLSQGLGAATAGLGILGAIGGSSGVAGGVSSISSGLGSLFSDERLKENIEPIGRTFDGQTMHRWNYRGDPTVHTGLIAQEVERRNPDAVGLAGGYKTVDYGAATDKAAERGRFARGGGLSAGRPHFIAGGGLAGVTDANNPIIMPGQNKLDFSADALTTGGVIPVAASQQQVRPAPLGLLSAPPVSAPPAPMPTPSGLASASAPASPAAPPPSSGFGGNPDGNRNMALLAAGLGMMGGTSPYAAANIGQGGLAGLQMYQQLNGADRANALAQSEIEARRAQSAISSREADLRAQELHQAAEQFGQKYKLESGEAAARIAGMNADTAQKLTTITPAGMLQRDPANPMAAPKIIPFDTGSAQGAAPAQPAGSPAIPVAAQSQPALVPVPDVSTIGAFDPPTNIPVNPRRIDPGYNKLVTEQAAKQLEAAQTSYAGSQQQKLTLTELQHALGEIPVTGYLAAGSGFDQRADVAKKVMTAMRTFGVEPKEEWTNAIAAGESAKKLSGRLGFDLAKSLGGREPGFIVQQSVGLNPSTENSPVGAQRLIAGLNAAAQRNIDLYNFQQKWSASTGGDLTGAEDYFNKHAPPESYAKSAIVSTLPASYVDRLKQAAAQNPSAATFFDQRFGKGTAAMVLGQ